MNFVQVDGWSALFYATDQGHLDIVKYLLENKADVSLSSKVSASKPLLSRVGGGGGFRGSRPLHVWGF